MQSSVSFLFLYPSIYLHTPSILLIHSLHTHVDLMVIHLSSSSGRVSVYLSPILLLATIPAFSTRESVRVVLPWSTWAITDMLRTFACLFMIAWTCMKSNHHKHVVCIAIRGERLDEYVCMNVFLPDQLWSVPETWSDKEYNYVLLITYLYNNWLLHKWISQITSTDHFEVFYL